MFRAAIGHAGEGASTKGGMDEFGSGEAGKRLGLSCGGRAVTCNLSARRTLTGAPDADGNRRDGLAHAEAGHALGAGGEGGWHLRTHVLRRPDATERAANDRGVQLSAVDKRARRDSLGRHDTDRLANANLGRPFWRGSKRQA